MLKSRLQLPEGEAGRRARFRISTAVVGEATARREDPLFRSAYLSEAESEDPALLSTTNALRHRTMQTCLQAAPAPIGEHEIPVRFEVGRDGEALSFWADWPAEVPAPLRACLEGELAKARFTCPLADRATLKTKLDLSLITLEELRRRRK